MNLLKPLTTPEYLFRPSQILHRFRRALRAPAAFETVTLPWGAPIRVRPAEVIGSNIWSYGVFDIMVTEAICRLLDPSEVGLDIGANIGQMTNLMRRQSGSKGRIVAFEPHPEVFEELKFNAETLGDIRDFAAVELHNLALSDHEGEAFLDLGNAWVGNRGVAKITATPTNDPEQKIAVTTTTLDKVLGPEIEVGVCKIDVEGHELMVLKGAKEILGARRMRDIIFEENSSFPSAVHKLLLECGFHLFSLNFNLWGPRLLPASASTSFDKVREGNNYLATLNPVRALERFKSRGWRSLRKGTNTF